MYQGALTMCLSPVLKSLYNVCITLFGATTDGKTFGEKKKLVRTVIKHPLDKQRKLLKLWAR